MISTPIDALLTILLQQHRKRILRLKTGWTNDFALAAQFESHTASATAFAESLTGASQPAPLTWTVQAAEGDPTDYDEQDSSNDALELDPIIESERLLLTDVISGELQEEVDGTDILVQNAHAQIIWVSPVR
jgi:hypothetical protein